jgi:hypothetical protein
MVQFGVSIPASLIDFHMTKQQSMHISETKTLVKAVGGACSEVLGFGDKGLLPH